MILRSVGVLSVGKILGCLYALFGLIGGGILSLLALAGIAAGGAHGPEAILFGAGAVIILPIIYGLFGLIGGVFAAVLYNLVAGVMGGIELDLTPIREDSYSHS